MDFNIILNILGIVGFIITVSSLVYAIYVKKVSDYNKDLVLEIMNPIPIAQVVSGQRNYSLKVVYEQEGNYKEFIDSAYIYYVRIANLGRKSIMKSDIVPSDPLTLVLNRGKVLDASICTVSRDVCNIELKDYSLFHLSETVRIDFDFLDYNDGAIIQILSDSDNLSINIKGTIIGMSKGVVQVKEPDSYQEISGVGCLIPTIVSILGILSTPFVYHYIMGTWKNIWIIGLPIVSVLIPLSIFMIIAYVFFKPKNKYKFPSTLIPPNWYNSSMGFRRNFKSIK